jgi:hypothetical protein
MESLLQNTFPSHHLLGQCFCTNSCLYYGDDKRSDAATHYNNRWVRCAPGKHRSVKATSRNIVTNAQISVN